MEIVGLDSVVAMAMTDLFTTKIFKYWSDSEEGTITATLNDNVILKCHGFDSSVRVELGAKMFILEGDNYWRIIIE